MTSQLLWKLNEASFGSVVRAETSDWSVDEQWLHHSAFCFLVPDDSPVTFACREELQVVFLNICTNNFLEEEKIA